MTPGIRSLGTLSLLLLAACGPAVRPVDDPAPAPSAEPFEQRLAALEQRIVADPGNAALYAERARLYMSVDSLRKAFKDWERAIAADSTNAGYRLERGDLYYRQTMVDRARADFERAIALAPDRPDPHLKLAEIELVLRHHREAMEQVNAALRMDPGLAQGYYLKGWIYKEAGDTALAISSLRTAVEQDPGHYSAFIQLGLLHAGLHDPLAEDYYRSALEIRPNSVEALYNLAMYLQEHGQDSLAMATYARIAEVDSLNALAPYNTGYIHLEHRQDPRTALAWFTRATDLNTNYHQAWYNRGVAYERLGRLDSAAADYQVALLIRPDYDPAAEGLQRVYARGAYVKEFDRRPRR
ncbi:MAG: tetratricopeptide repeat protein [Flavobacteriales bacterium]|nr:Photosystem I assembly protein Ycf3 [Flavobacteriales bacterium]MCC6578590.1 tetratricopeptide repeat protein [Flavobacteriales bacterium]NUQ15981.1 tetratricopeptide repeat protein [Flavobacteriales bacterium]